MSANLDLRLQFPSTMIVSGATGSGKTCWLEKFLKHANTILSEHVDRVVWCYGVYQPLVETLSREIPNLHFNHGCDRETLEQLGVFDAGQRTILVLDDLHQELASSTLLSQLFCKFSHHANTMVVFVTQNLYHKGSAMRDVTTNCHYLVCLAQPRDKSIMATLARQMFPGNSAYLLDAYRDATSQPFGYLIIDATPRTPDTLRLRSGIFPDEDDVAWLPQYK